MSINKEDLISVVVPAYNHEKYVVQTINSIAEQTYPRLELVIINDGSSDNTKQVVEAHLPKVKDRFENLIFRSRENKGVVKTLNECLSYIKGTYVTIIASDDIFTKDAIEVMHDFLSNNSDYQFVVGDNSFIDDDGKKCFWNRTFENVYEKNEARYLTFADFLSKSRKDFDYYSDKFGSYRTLLKGNYVTNGYLIRGDFFKKIGYYSKEARLEDYGLMLKIAKFGKMKFINQTLANYRWHDNNTVKQKDKMLEYYKQTVLLEKDYAIKNGYRKEFELSAYGIKRKGIPNILEIVKNKDTKTKTLRIFGFSIRLR